jgi:hypothetical protein
LPRSSASSGLSTATGRCKSPPCPDRRRRDTRRRRWAWLPIAVSLSVACDDSTSPAGQPVGAGAADAGAAEAGATVEPTGSAASSVAAPAPSAPPDPDARLPEECRRVVDIVRAGNRELARVSEDAAKDPAASLEDVADVLETQSTTLDSEELTSPRLSKEVDTAVELFRASAEASRRASEAAVMNDMDAMAVAQRDMARLTKQGDRVVERINQLCS